MTAKKETTTAPLIHAAILKVMREVGHIAKDRDSQQYRFRGIDDVYNALHQPMADAGIFTTSDIVEEIRSQGEYKKGGKYTKVTLRMTYHFTAEDGSKVSTTVQGEGDDMGDKAGNKAMAVAHKYALLQMFMIPTEESKDPEDKRIDPQQQGQQVGQMAGAQPQQPQQGQGASTAHAPASSAPKGKNAAWSRKYADAALKALEGAATSDAVLKIANQIKADKGKLDPAHVSELRDLVIVRMKELKEAFKAKA